MKSPLFILLITSSLLMSGCSKLESLRTDVQQQANQVKANITETKQNIDRKIQKVENVVNAVGELKKEL